MCHSPSVGAGHAACSASIRSLDFNTQPLILTSRGEACRGTKRGGSTSGDCICKNTTSADHVVAVTSLAGPAHGAVAHIGGRGAASGSEPQHGRHCDRNGVDETSWCRSSPDYASSGNNQIPRNRPFGSAVGALKRSQYIFHSGACGLI